MPWVVEDENNWRDELRDGSDEEDRGEDVDPDLADQDFYCEMKYAGNADEEHDQFMSDILGEIACDADDRVYIRDPWPGEMVGQVI